MANLAQVRGFGDVRHREAIHAGLQEARGDLGHTMTIGVGLHHRDIADMGREGLFDATDIAIDGRQVDLDPSARGGSIRRSAHQRWRSPDQVAKSLATFNASGRDSSRRNPD